MPINFHLVAMLVGILVVSIIMMTVGSVLDNNIAVVMTENPSWAAAGLNSTSTIQPTVDLIATMSKVLAIGSMIALVAALIYGAANPDNYSSWSGRETSRQEPERHIARTAAEAVQDRPAYQPPGEQPSGEKPEEEKKPEKRDRYEVVKV